MPEDPSYELGSPRGPCSPSDTIPASPEPLAGYKRDWQPFARLVPISRAARLAFESAIDVIKHEPHHYAHVRRNMFIEPARDESISVASTFTDSENAEAQGQHDRPPYRYNGHFCFRLDNPPRVPRTGWVLGDGRSSAAIKVDFLLSAPRQVKDIAGKHAVIFLHPRSCRLVLGPRHRASTTMQARSEGDASLTSPTSVVPAELGVQEQIRIGDCVYLFEYLGFANCETHEQQLAEFMKQTHGQNWEGVLKLLSSTPDASLMRLHNYTWPLGAFAKGTFGQVTAGTESKGDPVAIKRLHAPQEGQLSAHRRMMSHIGKHAYIIQLLDCYAGADANIPEAYCIYQPLACTSLFDAKDQTELLITTQVNLFRQYAEGLSFLHDEKGVMHRDIKPSNLGIVTWNPPVGVIFDLDSATREETSYDHMQGTLGFLAPEIVALKRWNASPSGEVRPSPYGRKVDVWALGLSAYMSFTGRVISNRPMSHMLFQIIEEDLEQKIRLDDDTVHASYAKIIRQMLSWDVDQRLTATQALEALQELEKQVGVNVTTDPSRAGTKRPNTGTPDLSPKRRIQQNS